MSATDRSSSRVQLVLKMMTNCMCDSTFAFVSLLLLRLLSAALMPTSSQLLWDLRPGGSGDGIRTRPRTAGQRLSASGTVVSTLAWTSEGCKVLGTG